jgi:predicted lipoprotein with Yx(FWY)xxD motif
MSRRVGVVAVLCLALVLGLLKLARREPHAGDWDSPLTTPPGITLQPRPASSHDAGAPEPDVLYADAQGRTLYVHESRAGTALPCEAECARHWPPMLAGPESQAMGEWTLSRRSDQRLQWALHGAPLYRDDADVQIGDSRGNGADAGTWHAAVFRPGEGLAFPVGIAARELPDAGGVALVDAQGLTLYAFLGDGRRPEKGCDTSDCQNHWLPLEAPAIAAGTPDFGVQQRPDGITQWAFRGHPLYRFEGDRLPGSANGIAVSRLYQVAVIARDFMPTEVTVVQHPALGRIVVTREGQTLYQRDRVDAAEGGHSFRVDHGSPELGRLFGTADCDDTCIRQWPAFRALPAAQASGYWQIAMRRDGTRQWVYRGYALYTYAGERPGETRGNYLYDVGVAQISQHSDISAAVASATPVATVGAVPIDPAAIPGSGIGTLFWHAVVP